MVPIACQVLHEELARPVTGGVLIHMGIGVVAADNIKVLENFFRDVCVQIKRSCDHFAADLASQEFQQFAAGIVVVDGTGSTVKGGIDAVDFPNTVQVVGDALQCVGEHFFAHPSAGGGYHDNGGDRLATGFPDGSYRAGHGTVDGHAVFKTCLSLVVPFGTEAVKG